MYLFCSKSASDLDIHHLIHCLRLRCFSYHLVPVPSPTWGEDETLYKKEGK